MNRAKVIIVLAIALTITLIIFGFNKYGHIKDLNNKSEMLLKKYNYNIEKREKLEKLTLGDSLPFELFYETSKGIGFDLRKYKGKVVEACTYKLKERSQATEGNAISAMVIFNDTNEVIGAFLMMEGYSPGVAPLNERSQLKPEGLKPDNLRFINVSSIQILGPWNDNGADLWTKRKSLNSQDREKFTALLEKSTVHKQNLVRDRDKNGMEYAIGIEYSNGSVVTIRYYKDTRKFIIDNFPNYFYEPGEELEKFIIEG